MTVRFTIDGNELLERRLGQVCTEVARAVKAMIPARQLEAIVLAGGYGRGEGGVLRKGSIDLPYNDLEFYVFLRGNRIWQEHRYRTRLCELGDRLSPWAGLHIEFKIDSIQRLRHGSVTMFTYDLISAHRVVVSKNDIFRGCEHHLQANEIPLVEATRLLFNRCTGLLLARELLCQSALSPEHEDFIDRNLAKAKLAMGDVVLTALRQYHWSCLERDLRLKRMTDEMLLSAPERIRHDDFPPLAEIKRHHSAGVKFKLHPGIRSVSREALQSEHGEVSEMASRLWLWLEGRRLSSSFSSARDYAFNPAIKWPGAPAWHNCLLNLRSFGPGALLDSMARRYPRERLLNSLPLLLWNSVEQSEPEVIPYLQKQLRTRASDWAGCVSAYKQVWPSYG